jgi:hypothetical protein
MHRELDELARLDRNWNGYQAAPIDPATIATARRLADQLDLSEAGIPQVVPMTHGRLQFEWHRGTRSLELELESSALVRYLKWDSSLGLSEEDTLPSEDMVRLQALLIWFAAG